MVWVFFDPDEQQPYQEIAAPQGRVLRHPLDSFAGDPEPHPVAVRGELGAEPEGLPVGFPVGVERRQGSRATGPVLTRYVDDDRRPVAHACEFFLPSKSFTIW